MMTVGPNSGGINLEFKVGFATDTLLRHTQGDVTRLGEIGGIIKSLYRLRRHVAAGEPRHCDVYVKASFFKAVLTEYSNSVICTGILQYTYNVSPNLPLTEKGQTAIIKTGIIARTIQLSINNIIFQAYRLWYGMVSHLEKVRSSSKCMYICIITL